MTEFLREVRRRLRWAWALTTLQLLAPAIAVAALFFVLLGRLQPWAWTEPAAAVAVIAGVAAVGVGAALLRIPVPLAARAADRGLGTGDAFATAVDLPDAMASSPVVARLRQRVDGLAAGRRAKDAVPFHLRRLPVTATGVVAALAVVLTVLPNHQDVVRRQRAAERALVRSEGKRLAEAAAALEKSAGRGPAQDATVEELRKLAAQLAGASSLSKGTKAVDDAAKRLTEKLDSNLVAEKAAVRGLDRSLAANPLPGAQQQSSAADQLKAAAAALGGLSPQQRADLASRLSALAATQSTGNSGAQQALAQAAQALQQGDLTAAAGAMQKASDAQRNNSDAVKGQDAVMSGLAEVGNSAQRLAAGVAPSGQQAGGQQGQGQGQGQGRGQGQGQAQNRGQGQGGGRGQGQSAGSPSGAIGGTRAATAPGATGGAGTPNGTGHNASVDVQTAKLYDPIASANGEQLNATGKLGQGPSTQIGKSQGPVTQGRVGVPLTSVLGRYEAEATRALDGLDLPPSVRALVRAYFDSLNSDDNGDQP